MKTRLVKAVAPMFWTRWTVETTDGTRLGRVEKRGMSSPWYAYDVNHENLGTFATRADALAALVEAGR